MSEDTLTRFGGFFIARLIIVGMYTGANENKSTFTGFHISWMCANDLG
ncbi:MAG: hypothetical protein V3S35_07030 [Nitrosomonadaceae bacterium]